MRNPDGVRPWQHVLEPLGGYLLLGARLAGAAAPTRAASASARPGTSARAPRTRRPVRDVVEALVEAWGGGSWEDRRDPRRAARGRRCSGSSIEKAHARLGWTPALALRGDGPADRRLVPRLPRRRAGQRRRSPRCAWQQIRGLPGVDDATRRTLERKLTAEILERVRQIARLRQEAERRVRAGQDAGAVRGPGLRRGGDGEPRRERRSTSGSRAAAGTGGSRTSSPRWYGVAARAARELRLVGEPARGRRAHLAQLGERRLRPGDEVITVAAGFPTTVTPDRPERAASRCSSTSSSPPTTSTSARSRRRSSPRTRAVMLAHTLGNPFDLDAVAAFCARARPLAHRGQLRRARLDATAAGRPAPSATSATLSFYPPHHITMGEGGAVLTRRRRAAARRRELPRLGPRLLVRRRARTTPAASASSGSSASCRAATTTSTSTATSATT